MRNEKCIYLYTCATTFIITTTVFLKMKSFNLRNNFCDKNAKSLQPQLLTNLSTGHIQDSRPANLVTANITGVSAAFKPHILYRYTVPLYRFSDLVYLALFVHSLHFTFAPGSSIYGVSIWLLHDMVTK